jgi:hypothetical protein
MRKKQKTFTKTLLKFRAATFTRDDPRMVSAIANIQAMPPFTNIHGAKVTC